jgi:hypothetical protein
MGIHGNSWDGISFFMAHFSWEQIGKDRKLDFLNGCPMFNQTQVRVARPAKTRESMIYMGLSKMG